MDVCLTAPLGRYTYRFAGCTLKTKTVRRGLKENTKHEPSCHFSLKTDRMPASLGANWLKNLNKWPFRGETTPI